VQFGLLLAVGAVTLLAAGWMFGKIAEDVVTRDRLSNPPQPKVTECPSHVIRSQGSRYAGGCLVNTSAH
jgi:hypothetical protein